jgi:predicted regulator of Ras-like GTPase activity (Roadblock/LC7/MglB family)
MMFQEILAEVIEETPGGLAAAILGVDGIPVDEYGSSEVDLATLAVEFQSVLEGAKKVSGAIYGGEGLQEMILTTSDYQLFFRQLDDEYFLALALERAGSLGKARYLVARVLHDLREGL